MFQLSNPVNQLSLRQLVGVLPDSFLLCRKILHKVGSDREQPPDEISSSISFGDILRPSGFDDRTESLHPPAAAAFVLGFASADEMGAATIEPNFVAYARVSSAPK
jgi:hypothetical protein